MSEREVGKNGQATDDDTETEDEDGMRIPKRGEGSWGQGAPGMWAPGDRQMGTSPIPEVLWTAWASSLDSQADVKKLACVLAVGKLTTITKSPSAVKAKTKTEVTVGRPMRVLSQSGVNVDFLASRGFVLGAHLRNLHSQDQPQQASYNLYQLCCVNMRASAQVCQYACKHADICF